MVKLTRIYTKTGDKGKTSLVSGKRVSKDNIRIRAYGTVDELNSILGVVKHHVSKKLIKVIAEIQNDLFDIGGQISLNEDGANIITSESITSLDNYIDQYNSSLDPLKEFILPGGDLFSANLHVARSVTRRAERAVVELYSDSLENNNVVMYLNRLSDYFFVLSRFYNKSENISENTWKR